MLLVVLTTAGFTKKPKKVVIKLDTKVLEIKTTRKTVKGLLQEAHIKLGAKDKIKPGLTYILEDGMTIIIHRDKGKVRNSLPNNRGSIKTSRGEFRYRSMVKMNASAYSVDRKYGRQTASGITARYGVVAVDPGFIPLGSRLYIEGYGPALAADTGSAIKGNRIDLFFEDNVQVSDFGRQKVQVYILE